MADLYLNGPGTDVEGDIFLFGPTQTSFASTGRRPRNRRLTRQRAVTVPTSARRRTHVHSSHTAPVPVGDVTAHRVQGPSLAAGVDVSVDSQSACTSVSLALCPVTAVSSNDDGDVLALIEG